MHLFFRAQIPIERELGPVTIDIRDAISRIRQDGFLGNAAACSAFTGSMASSQLQFGPNQGTVTPWTDLIMLAGCHVCQTLFVVWFLLFRTNLFPYEASAKTKALTQHSQGAPPQSACSRLCCRWGHAVGAIPGGSGRKRLKYDSGSLDTPGGGTSDSDADDEDALPAVEDTMPDTILLQSMGPVGAAGSGSPGGGGGLTAQKPGGGAQGHGPHGSFSPSFSRSMHAGVLASAPDGEAVIDYPGDCLVDMCCCGYEVCPCCCIGPRGKYVELHMPQAGPTPKGGGGDAAAGAHADSKWQGLSNEVEADAKTKNAQVPHLYQVGRPCSRRWWLYVFVHVSVLVVTAVLAALTFMRNRTMVTAAMAIGTTSSLTTVFGLIFVLREAPNTTKKRLWILSGGVTFIVAVIMFLFVVFVWFTDSNVSPPGRVFACASWHLIFGLVFPVCVQSAFGSEAHAQGLAADAEAASLERAQFVRYWMHEVRVPMNNVHLSTQEALITIEEYLASAPPLTVVPRLVRLGEDCGSTHRHPPAPQNTAASADVQFFGGLGAPSVQTDGVARTPLVAPQGSPAYMGLQGGGGGTPSDPMAAWRPLDDGGIQHGGQVPPGARIATIAARPGGAVGQSDLLAGIPKFPDLAAVHVGGGGGSAPPPNTAERTEAGSSNGLENEPVGLAASFPIRQVYSTAEDGGMSARSDDSGEIAIEPELNTADVAQKLLQERLQQARGEAVLPSAEHSDSETGTTSSSATSPHRLPSLLSTEHSRSTSSAGISSSGSGGPLVNLPKLGSSATSGSTSADQGFAVRGSGPPGVPRHTAAATAVSRATGGAMRGPGPAPPSRPPPKLSTAGTGQAYTHTSTTLNSSADDNSVFDGMSLQSSGREDTFAYSESGCTTPDASASRRDADLQPLKQSTAEDHGSSTMNIIAAARAKVSSFPDGRRGGILLPEGGLSFPDVASPLREGTMGSIVGDTGRGDGTGSVYGGHENTYGTWDVAGSVLSTGTNGMQLLSELGVDVSALQGASHVRPGSFMGSSGQSSAAGSGRSQFSTKGGGAGTISDAMLATLAQQGVPEWDLQAMATLQVRDRSVQEQRAQREMARRAKQIAARRRAKQMAEQTAVDGDTIVRQMKDGSTTVVRMDRDHTTGTVKSTSSKRTFQAKPAGKRTSHAGPRTFQMPETQYEMTGDTDALTALAANMASMEGTAVAIPAPNQTVRRRRVARLLPGSSEGEAPRAIPSHSQSREAGLAATVSASEVLGAGGGAPRSTGGGLRNSAVSNKTTSYSTEQRAQLWGAADEATEGMQSHASFAQVPSSSHESTSSQQVLMGAEDARASSGGSRHRYSFNSSASTSASMSPRTALAKNRLAPVIEVTNELDDLEGLPARHSGRSGGTLPKVRISGRSAGAHLSQGLVQEVEGLAPPTRSTTGLSAKAGASMMTAREGLHSLMHGAVGGHGFELVIVPLVSALSADVPMSEADELDAENDVLIPADNPQALRAACAARDHAAATGGDQLAAAVLAAQTSRWNMNKGRAGVLMPSTYDGHGITWQHSSAQSLGLWKSKAQEHSTRLEKLFRAWQLRHGHAPAEESAMSSAGGLSASSLGEGEVLGGSAAPHPHTPVQPPQSAADALIGSPSGHLGGPILALGVPMAAAPGGSIPPPPSDQETSAGGGFTSHEQAPSGPNVLPGLAGLNDITNPTTLAADATFAMGSELQEEASVWGQLLRFLDENAAEIPPALMHGAFAAANGPLPGMALPAAMVGFAEGGVYSLEKVLRMMTGVAQTSDIPVVQQVGGMLGFASSENGHHTGMQGAAGANAPAKASVKGGPHSPVGIAQNDAVREGTAGSVVTQLKARFADDAALSEAVQQALQFNIAWQTWAEQYQSTWHASMQSFARNVPFLSKVLPDSVEELYGSGAARPATAPAMSPNDALVLVPRSVLSDVREMLKVSLQGTHAMKEVANSVLDWIRVSSGFMSFVEEPFDLLEAVNEEARMYERQFKDKQVALTVETTVVDKRFWRQDQRAKMQRRALVKLFVQLYQQLRAEGASHDRSMQQSRRALVKRLQQLGRAGFVSGTGNGTSVHSGSALTGSLPSTSLKSQANPASLGQVDVSRLQMSQGPKGQIFSFGGNAVGGDVDMGPGAQASIADMSRIGQGQRVIVKADKVRIQQCMRNLVSNAYKHAPAGTEVTLGMYVEVYRMSDLEARRAARVAEKEEARVRQKKLRQQRRRRRNRRKELGGGGTTAQPAVEHDDLWLEDHAWGVIQKADGLVSAMSQAPGGARNDAPTSPTSQVPEEDLGHMALAMAGGINDDGTGFMSANTHAQKRLLGGTASASQPSRGEPTFDELTVHTQRPPPLRPMPSSHYGAGVIAGSDIGHNDGSSTVDSDDSDDGSSEQVQSREDALQQLRLTMETLHGPMTDAQFDEVVQDHLQAGLSPMNSDSLFSDADSPKVGHLTLEMGALGGRPQLGKIAEEKEGSKSTSNSLEPSSASGSSSIPAPVSAFVPRLKLPTPGAWVPPLDAPERGSVNDSDARTATSETGFSQYALNFQRMAAGGAPATGSATPPGAAAKKDDVMVHIRFEVTDKGIGMTKEEIGRLFKPFSQLREGAKQAGSSGLGLTLVKAIVERLDGGILATSPGKHKGSTFMFYMSVPSASSGEALGHADANGRSVQASDASIDQASPKPSTVSGITPSGSSGAPTQSLSSPGARSLLGRHASEEGKQGGAGSMTYGGGSGADGGGDYGHAGLDGGPHLLPSLGNRPQVGLPRSTSSAQTPTSAAAAGAQRFGMAKLSSQMQTSSSAGGGAGGGMSRQGSHSVGAAATTTAVSALESKTSGGAMQSMSSVASRSVAGQSDKTLPGTVVVVDDTAVTRQLLSRIVKKSFPATLVLTAEHGADALQVFMQHEADVRKGVLGAKGAPLHPINCVLMDKSMPVMDGFTAAISLRNLHGYTGHIIGVTGNALQQDIKDFKANGATSVLTKPVDRKLLQSAVRGALSL